MQRDNTQIEKTWAAYERIKVNHKLNFENNKPFSEIVESIFKEKNVTEANIERKTGLFNNYYNRLRNTDKKGLLKVDKEYVPSMAAIVSLCVGLDLDLPMANTLLYSLGLDFVKRKEIHTIYCYLIGHCRDIDFENKEVHDQFEEEYGFGSSEDNHTLNPYINYCNVILRDYGITNINDFLGSRKRKMISE